ncbi:MAG: glucose-6-phosphate isomerase [Nitrospirae bacterium]|nr:MAG: glucose-6-phosphate isomerase [Nitrospirota bacterium]
MPDSRLNAHLGPLEADVSAALAEMAAARVASRLWAKDYTLWKPAPTEITNRLGWLTVAEQMREHVGSLKAFAQSVRDDGYSHVVLLGMGGSSLGPEVLRCTFGSARGFPRLFVLDSTVPSLVREVTKAIRPATTLFILASKSGGTIEVMSLFAHFWRLVETTRGSKGGKQFVAVTDPGTGLAALARERGFLTTFTNQPDIGGRYSVLSHFGLVPAALLGLDLDTLVGRGVEMATACGPDRLLQDNPGAHLGAIMGTLGRSGRDKVTLITSPKVKTFGLWAEQLLAESTGKEGKGLIPIAEEPLVSPAAYGHDRLFVYLRLNGDANKGTDRHVKALERVGHPVVQLTLRDRYDLAGQFFLWEFATAVAGRLLGIHPFDQPNVQESKENTKRILDEVRLTGRMPPVPVDQTLADLLKQAGPGKYLAILAYMCPSVEADAALKVLRRRLLLKYRLPTTVGYGPRYLHSTGQLHKGGPATGLFLELVEEMTPKLEVPGAPYTFGTLAEAQSVGDLQSLQTHHRPVVRIQLGRQPLAKIRALARAVRPAKALRRRPTRRVRKPGGKRAAKR